MLLQCQSRLVVAVTVPQCVVFAFKALVSLPSPLAVELRDCCPVALLLLLLLVVVNLGCDCHRCSSPGVQEA